MLRSAAATLSGIAVAAGGLNVCRICIIALIIRCLSDAWLPSLLNGRRMSRHVTNELSAVLVSPPLARSTFIRIDAEA